MQMFFFLILQSAVGVSPVNLRLQYVTTVCDRHGNVTVARWFNFTACQAARNWRIHQCVICRHLPSFWSKETPPPGRFSIYYVPWSRAVCKRFHDEMRPSRLVVKSLTHGSWSGNIVNRKRPRGGVPVVSFDQFAVICHHLPSFCTHVYEMTDWYVTWLNRGKGLTGIAMHTAVACMSCPSQDSPMLEYYI